MSETRFTPGPWEVDATVALGAYGVWTGYATHPGHDGAGYPSEVCSVFRGNESDFDQETRNANAALISAAPELLAQLKIAVNILFGAGSTADSLASMRAVIAKAEGREC